MKILIVLPNNAHGGAEQYLKMIASYFKDDSVRIIFLKKGKSLFWDNLKSSSVQERYSTQSETIGFIKFAFFSLFKKQQNYDYVFTSHVYTNGLLGFLIRLNKIKAKKFIARESTSIFLRYKGFSRFVYKMMYRFGYKKIDLLICQTHLMKEQLLKHLPYLEKRTNIRVIGNPIDLKLIEEKSMAESSLEVKGKYIVSAGRLIPEKGFDILIRAFKTIYKNDKHYQLVILGEGYQKEELVALAKDLNIEASVVFPGHVSNVYTYFKNAELCVVSSRIEGFPNVLLQMMSQNDTVVSTLCAGGIDTINGVVTAQTNNTEDLASAMRNALENKSKNENKIIFANYLKTRDIPQFIKTVLEA